MKRFNVEELIQFVVMGSVFAGFIAACYLFAS